MGSTPGGVRLSAAGNAVRQTIPVEGLAQEPIRTCVGCRERASRSKLLRVVVAECVGGVPVVIPDPRHRRPGRGAWLHPDQACLALAERRRAFPRALRRVGWLDTGTVREYLAAGSTGGPASSGARSHGEQDRKLT